MEGADAGAADIGSGGLRRETGGHAQALRLAVACGVALACNTYQTWLLNNGVFPTTSEVFPLARELQTLIGIAAGVFVLLAAMRRPRLLRPAPLALASLAALLVGALILTLAPRTPLTVSVGLMVLAAGGALPFYLIGLGYAALGPCRMTSVSVACALLASALASTLLSAPGFVPSVWLGVGLSTLAIALPWYAGAPAMMGRIAKTQAAEPLLLASPQSFLSPFHQVYVLMFIFSVAFGFALSLNISLFTPVGSNLQIVILAVAAGWFVLARRDRAHEDTLFALAALLIDAGFLFAPLASLSDSSLANGLLYAGKSCFDILSWTAIAALCARNLGASMLVLGCCNIAGSAGTFVGADLGHLCNALLGAGPQAATLVSASAALALFAYVLLGLRGFSFAGTIRGIEPLPAGTGTAVPAPEPSRDELLDRACDELASECGLTEREREVLGMLARGHNGYHIRDELTLSYNTVKTHVKRIYRKLDVHSQQELIDLADTRVEREEKTQAARK